MSSKKRRSEDVTVISTGASRRCGPGCKCRTCCPRKCPTGPTGPNAFNVAETAALFYRNADQEVANNDSDPIVWQAELVNRGVWSGSAPTRFTVPAGASGLYLISAGIEWEADNDGVRVVEMVLNGTTSIAAVNQGSTQGVVTLQAVSTSYYLVAGDYLEVFVLHTAGNALDVIGGSQYSNFRMVRISS